MEEESTMAYPVYCDHLNVDESIVWANSTAQTEQSIASLWQFKPVGVCPRIECNFANPKYLENYEPTDVYTAKIVIAAHFLTVAASFFATWAALHKDVHPPGTNLFGAVNYYGLDVVGDCRYG